MKKRLFFVSLISVLMTGLAMSATVGSRFDPTDYSSNGSLILEGSNKVSFNTTDLTYTTNGTPAISGGTNITSDSSNVEVCMFNFDSISIIGGASVTIQSKKGAR
ncbi:MAG: hypothetical protein PF692_13815 [Kiritimatiellae bacterium]|nr:hypothetical protein [Kiritimatiellia bacterium]